MPIKSKIAAEIAKRVKDGDTEAIEYISSLKSLGISSPQIVADDARFGELGKVDNPLGGISTEFSLTEFIPELGGWVNIPTLVRGQVDIDSMLSGAPINQAQFDIARNRAIERVGMGAALPSFSSADEAVSAAVSRTEKEKLRPFVDFDRPINGEEVSVIDNGELKVSQANREAELDRLDREKSNEQAGSSGTNN